MTRGGRERDLEGDPHRRPGPDPAAQRAAETGKATNTTPLGIQLGELVPWVRAHPIRGMITLILAAGAIGSLLNPPVEALPNRLSPGDCLYARTAAAEQQGDAARPVGESGDVEAVIDAGAAVRAACGLSHGHEVTAIMAVALPGHGSLSPSSGAGASLVPVEATAVTPGPPGATPAASADATLDVDRAAIRASVQAVCDSTFAGYIAHPLAGSEYVTFAVIPSAAQLETGPQLALCLVARADGQWMTGPAKNSGS